jgi:hypothetical protein
MSDTKSIIEWHLDGHTRADIIELLKADGESKPEKVIDAALSEMAATMGTGDQEMAWYKGALRRLYQKNIEISDLKSAHAVIRDMMVLDGALSRSKEDSDRQALDRLVGRE